MLSNPFVIKEDDFIRISGTHVEIKINQIIYSSESI